MKLKLLIFVFIAFLVLSNCAPQPSSSGNGGVNDPGEENQSRPGLYLRKAIGTLRVDALASTETYEAYFHIPISFKEQVPVLIEIESPDLIDYRFVHLGSPNVIAAARLRQAPETDLTWTAWVLTKDSGYTRMDVPDFLPIPSLEELPDETKKWLQPTGCVQVDAPIVQEIAASLRGTTTNLIELTDDIASYCFLSIPGGFSHHPKAFDAVYALRWGNSCTGHAHAGAALLRANGIPARSLLNIMLSPEYYPLIQDMHWIVDYYVPDYGWVNMETSMGINFCGLTGTVVVMVADPGHECPVFYPGIEGMWHTSDPVLGVMNPQWGRSHHGHSVNSFDSPPERIDQAHSLTQSVFDHYTNCWGIHLSSSQQADLDAAYNFQSDALDNILDSDIGSYIANMQEALNHYENIDPEPVQTLFFDDFENGVSGWTHGGIQDEWELGTPLFGASNAYSGDNCWATDLDDTYGNNADCWLLSPSISLDNLACAYLSFRVWNWVQDGVQGVVIDPLWLDITTDGTTFYPLCSHMGGVNDDPEIPDSGGWNKLVLDLFKYIGRTVQIRFRFQSDGENVQPGSFIDDVRVYGRRSI